MGIFDSIKKQFIDVIEWSEETDGVLAFRYPMADNEIQSGASLTVRESQIALFLDEGQIADVFGPGRHTLNTSTLPVLTGLRNWDKLFESPFKSDVFFYSTRDQLDCRWGTAAPITFRDKEFGPIRLRAFGTYSYRVEDAATFHAKVSGTKSPYFTSDLDRQLKAEIVTDITTFLAKSEIPFLDMAANLADFSNHLKDVLALDFAAYGLKLQTFLVQSLSLPQELQDALDKQTKMRMVGNLQQYTQYQVAESIPDAARNEGGLAGAGVGLGAGMGIGQAVAGAMTGAMGGGGGGSAASGGGEPEDAYAKLEKLHALLKKGIITQEDFDKKKGQLLDQL